MILEDLKTSVSKMSTDELMKLILSLRASRRTHKVKPAAKKQESKAAESLDKMIAELNPDKMKKLIELLGGKK